MAFSVRPIRISAAFAIIQMLCCLNVAVMAGTTGTLSGTVSDSITHEPLAGATRDPRYHYGAPGGSGYNYADCASILGFATTAAGAPTGGIPDPYTGNSTPSALLSHLRNF